jgi:hypothetical protein
MSQRDVAVHVVCGIVRDGCKNFNMNADLSPSKKATHTWRRFIILPNQMGKDLLALQNQEGDVVVDTPFTKGRHIIGNGSDDGGSVLVHVALNDLSEACNAVLLIAIIE